MYKANERYEIIRLFLNGKENKHSSNNGTDFVIEPWLLHSRRCVYKIAVEESELIRMLLAVDPDGCKQGASGLRFISGLIELQVSSTDLYRDAVIPNDGVITLNGTAYRRFICAAGHARSSKAFFVREDLWSKLFDIILCGMAPDAQFISTKINAYMGMVASNSTPVTMPRIVVVPDCEISVCGEYDFVSGNIMAGEYAVTNNVNGKVAINPFDGAGIVDVRMADQWQQDLGLTYRPSAFQFRCTPGIKGCAFTFDIQKFMNESGRTTITDCWGSTVDCSSGIDLILTESQFKFHTLYSSFEEWYYAFQKPIYGYNRTFNIATVSLNQRDLDTYTTLAYQHLQTLQLTRSEIKDLAKTTIERIKKIHTDPKAFCIYRGIRKYNDETGDTDESWNRIPPHFKALYYNPKLFNDPFIRNEVKDAVRSIKEGAYVGKLLVNGNYEILAPDLYGLTQHAFGMPVTGILKANEIYSGYWMNKQVHEVDMIRNPHVAREHNLMAVSYDEPAKEWFKYQTATIVTGMYDTAVMKCNGADFDGDTVLTTRNKVLINAVKREPSNTIVSQFEKQKGKTCALGDLRTQMEADLAAFKGNIGNIINPISTLWSLPQTDESQDIIKIMSVVASLEIDAAKTGISPKVPDELERVLDGVDPPYFMRYRKATANRKGTDMDKFCGKQDCTMNRICFHMEEELAGLEAGNPDVEYNFSELMSGSVNEYRKPYGEIKQKLLELQGDYNYICQEYDKSIKHGSFQKQFDSFFGYCKAELLSICPDYNKLLDNLIYLYYLDKDVILHCQNKSIMWRTFPAQMIGRAKGNFAAPMVDLSKLQSIRQKRRKEVLKIKDDAAKAKGIDFSNPVEVKDSDIMQIINNVDGENERRLLAAFDIVSRANGQGNRAVIDIRRNGHGKISPSQVSSLAGIDKRRYSNTLNFLGQQGFVTINQSTDNTRQLIDVKLPISNGNILTSISNVKEMVAYIEKTYREKKSGKNGAKSPDT